MGGVRERQKGKLEKDGESMYVCARDWDGFMKPDGFLKAARCSQLASDS